jgi:hypothetical protein
MLISLFVDFIFSYEWFVNESNINALIRKSNTIPVFLAIYSSRCSHCHRIMPLWNQAMATYANVTDIVLASVEVVQHRSSVYKLIRPSGYPAFVRIIRGTATELSVGRTYEKFCEEAELIRKQNLLKVCRFYSPFAVMDYPSVVLTTPSTEKESCALLYRTCWSANVPFAQCFMGKGSSISYNLTFFYTDVNLTIGNLSRSELTRCVSDFVREPFGDWDLQAAKRSMRRLLILVFGYAWQIVDVKGIGRAFLRDFAMVRVSLDDFVRRIGIGAYEIQDTPLYVVSNRDRTRYLIWSDVRDTQTLRDRLNRARNGEFDSDMTFSIDRIIPHVSAGWVLPSAAMLAGIVVGILWTTKRRNRKME